MSTYSYKCDDCDHRFDHIQPMSSDPLKICPECGEEAVRRLISKGIGVIFKGSGFFATDYKSPPKLD